jgi:hypothetical protein
MRSPTRAAKTLSAAGVASPGAMGAILPPIFAGRPRYQGRNEASRSARLLRLCAEMAGSSGRITPSTNDTV